MRNSYGTVQKKLIREYLVKNKQRFVSVAEIIDELKTNDINIGQVTIYRFLNKLAENNELRIEIKQNTKYFQLISDECNNHFHLKCNQCGKIIHLDCEEFNDISKHIKEEHKFIIDNNTMIYGTCIKCSKIK